MATARRCDFCGQPYIAKNSRSRFCSDKCRADNKGAPPVGASSGASGQTVVKLSAELEAAGVDSSVAEGALVLAARIDASSTPPSALPALLREFRAARAEIFGAVAAEGDPIDELRNLRDAKRGREAAG